MKQQLIEFNEFIIFIVKNKKRKYAIHLLVLVAAFAFAVLMYSRIVDFSN
ncbi:hypothetical protein M2444_006162 [Paenibacillus sp. PastF-3]|nr:hypothetical protein [Paenibacillus sp. PastF-3]MDH6374312.1 hypothetical protein [Paenibacillus sp. PastF-3]